MTLTQCWWSMCIVTTSVSEVLWYGDGSNYFHNQEEAIQLFSLFLWSNVEWKAGSILIRLRISSVPPGWEMPSKTLWGGTFSFHCAHRLFISFYLICVHNHWTLIKRQKIYSHMDSREITRFNPFGLGNFINVIYIYITQKKIF